MSKTCDSLVFFVYLITKNILVLPPPGGLICNYAQCSPTSPCTVGTCNNGYCCSPAMAPIQGPAPLLNGTFFFKFYKRVFV